MPVAARDPGLITSEELGLVGDRMPVLSLKVAIIEAAWLKADVKNPGAVGAKDPLDDGGKYPTEAESRLGMADGDDPGSVDITMTWDWPEPYEDIPDETARVKFP